MPMGICGYHLRSGEKATAGKETGSWLAEKLWRDLPYALAVINSTFKVIDNGIVV